MIELPGFSFRRSRYGDMAAFPASYMKAAEACIGFNVDSDFRITEILITDDADLWRRKSERFEMTGGACYADWCVPPSKRRVLGWAPDQLFDPLGTFGSFLAFGFASRRAMLSCIAQFAALDSCFWARRILFAISGEWTQKDIEPCARDAAP